MASPIDLTGRRILITGAAGGIGGAAARLCVEQGADVLLADLDERRIAEHVGDLGGHATAYRCDTSRRAEVEALVAAAGPVYGLIDCAAVCPGDDWTEEDWDTALDRVLTANVKGPLNLTRAVLPGMAARGEGRIVLFGSIAGWMGGLRSGPHYAFSKGGIHSFTRWLARRGAPNNVLVNAIAPGPVDTGMIAGLGFEPEHYPLKRLARPEEVAAVALFLCGPGAGYMTGAVVDVNGGAHYR